MQNISSAAYIDTKPHYDILDGLRGVAALMVVWYHVFEGFCTSSIDQHLNHGYLAVDFFFILSGFVIGYAYDDRWKKKMSMGGFFKRRLIRLHPMVILGVILGAITFGLQGAVKWDGTHVTLSMVMCAMLLNLFLIPQAPGMGSEVRGNGEMFPLNGPNWSLFFEYIGNILYALIIHRMSTKALKVMVGLLGVALLLFATLNLSGGGHIGVGWTMADYNLPGGLLRMFFSYSVGLLLSRDFKPIRVKGAFGICSLSIVVLLAIPHVGGMEMLWLNGLYDCLCVMLFFPILLYVGASGSTTDSKSNAICKFLGDISYPLYVVHYPFMYLFFAWVWNKHLTFAQAWPVAIVEFLGCILLAYLSLKLYDEPVRRWLSRRFLPSKRASR